MLVTGSMQVKVKAWNLFTSMEVNAGDTLLDCQVDKYIQVYKTYLYVIKTANAIYQFY